MRKPPTWVKTSERLPEPSRFGPETYVVTMIDGMGLPYISMLTFDGEKFVDEGINFTSAVTAWLDWLEPYAE